MGKLIAKYSSSAHELLLQFLSVGLSVGVRRGSPPPVCWPTPARAGGLGQMLACAPRGRSTRTWGAGARRVRVPCRPDRVRRPLGRSHPVPRRHATTHGSWPVPDNRCTCGQVVPSPGQGKVGLAPLSSTLPVGGHKFEPTCEAPVVEVRAKRASKPRNCGRAVVTALHPSRDFDALARFRPSVSSLAQSGRAHAPRSFLTRRCSALHRRSGCRSAIP